MLAIIAIGAVPTWFRILHRSARPGPLATGIRAPEPSASRPSQPPLAHDVDITQIDLPQDQKAREQEDLERKILEGLDSPTRQMTAADWKDLRATLEAKLGKRKKAQ